MAWWLNGPAPARAAAGLAEALSDGGCGLDAGAVLRLPPP
jgi:hypothetical protein